MNQDFKIESCTRRTASGICESSSPQLGEIYLTRCLTQLRNAANKPSSNFHGD